ncbi:MAG: IS1634 family transposase [Peptococcaceae bacterium]|nr:IS1634 family transposase [Peptococcaceae bacterium]
MFFRKITCRTNSKEYTYLKLIENYREGNKIKQKVIANFGNIESLTPQKVHGLISGLSRICGVTPNSAYLESKKVLRYGEVLAIHKIWEMLKFSNIIEEAVSHKKTDISLPLLTELMAINQIIKPQNKQAIDDWYQCLCLTEPDNKKLHANHFYNALDTLAESKVNIEKNIFKSLSRLVPITAEFAFCRLSTGTLEMPPRMEHNPSSYSKYFMEEPDELNKIDFGIISSPEGIPFGHLVFQNVSEEWAFKDLSDYLKNNFNIDKCIFIGDRNITANINLELLVAYGYEYVISRKPRTGKHHDLYHHEKISGKNGFTELNDNLRYKEINDGDLRYLICIDTQSSNHKREILKAKIDSVERELQAIKKAVAEKNDKSNKTVFNKNAAIFKNIFCRKYFKWHYDERIPEFNYLRLDELLDQELCRAGMFILETNSKLLSGKEILESYTQTAQLAESFRVIKSFEINPGRLYLHSNISANITVCILAAILETTMDRFLRRAGIKLTPRQALELLEEIKLSINQLDDMEVKSVTRIPKTQEEILQAIGVDAVQRIII